MVLKLKEFRNLVRREFGPGMAHATPANVREFLDSRQAELFTREMRERIILNETATSYEEILKDFFARVLDMPQEEAIIMLWTLACDLSFASIELQHAERLGPLFKDIQE
ncbi:MAG: hypothetical protein IT210_01155 [Armatimonadetes bacterium]|nr:hypothetical protein [Armatimonadota bacterium]